MLEAVGWRTKDDYRNGPTAEVLLIAQVLIHRDEYGVPVGDGIEERAVTEIGPALLVNRPDVVARKQPRELLGQIAV